MGKIAVALLGAIVLLAAVMPPGLYWLGLSNIEGRPQPPGNIRDATADRALLQRDLRLNDPIVIEVLNPWSVFVSTVRLDENSRSNRAAGTVAAHYNSDHVKHHGMLWWHLSELSLMIWLSRRWTADEIITAAAALARSHPNPSLQSSMVLQSGRTVVTSAAVELGHIDKTACESTASASQRLPTPCVPRIGNQVG
jgi:hypothetical protein